MKTKFLILFAALFMAVGTTQAKGVIIYGNGPKVEHVKDLPNEPDFKIYDDNGKVYHADLGVKYKQFSLFWIPIWNYETPKYVLYTKETKTSDYDFFYADLDEDELENIRKNYDIDFPANPQLSFWNQVGGKILILFIIALIVWYSVFFTHKKKEIDLDDAFAEEGKTTTEENSPNN